jgi:hypothetical protein
LKAWIVGAGAHGRVVLDVLRATGGAMQLPRAGAVAINRVRIGRGTVAGADAVVMRDLPENILVLGNPDRIVERIPGFDWKRVL